MRKEFALLSPKPFYIFGMLCVSIGLAGCSVDNMRVKQPLFGHDGNGGGQYQQGQYQKTSQAPRAEAWDIAKNYNYSNRDGSTSAYQQQPVQNSYGNNYNAYMGNEVTGSLNNGVNSQSLAPINQGYQQQNYQPVQQNNYNVAPVVNGPLVRPAPRPQASSWQAGPQGIQQNAGNQMQAAVGAGAIQVQQGDTLMNLAKRYNVQPADILRVNNLSSAEQIAPGQMLNLPTQNWNNITQKPVQNGVQNITNQYQNQNSDAPQGYRPPAVQYQPWKRTSLNQSTLVQLAANTAIMNDATPVGFVGNITPRPATRPQQLAMNDSVPQAATSYAVHEARSGETYNVLAKRYGLSASVISHANGATPSSHIEVGQRIVVPGLNQNQLQMLQASNGQQQVAKRAANDNEVITGSAPQEKSKPDVAPKISKEIKSKDIKKDAVKSVVDPKKTSAKDAAPVAKTKTASITPIPTQKPVTSKTSDPVTTGSIPTSQSQEKVVAVDKSEVVSSLKFRWPVKGRVVSSFGSKTQAGQNDGVNIAVPEGTPVKAAEDGTVAYTGNELKGYGNLVLLSHNDGTVTAYAHNSEILVKKGEKITRGQTVAKAGQTGSVNQPQVHFEIRKGSKPVDPIQFLPNG